MNIAYRFRIYPTEEQKILLGKTFGCCRFLHNQMLDDKIRENHAGDYEAVIDEYEQYLSEFVYDKIWSELSQKDRIVARGIAEVDDGKIKDIREHLGMETNEFNPYRKRLIKKGILSGELRGYVYFTLPLFDQYVIENS